MFWWRNKKITLFGWKKYLTWCYVHYQTLVLYHVFLDMIFTESTIIMKKRAYLKIRPCIQQQFGYSGLIYDLYLATTPDKSLHPPLTKRYWYCFLFLHKAYLVEFIRNTVPRYLYPQIWWNEKNIWILSLSGAINCTNLILYYLRLLFLGWNLGPPNRGLNGGPPIWGPWGPPFSDCRGNGPGPWNWFGGWGKKKTHGLMFVNQNTHIFLISPQTYALQSLR